MGGKAESTAQSCASRPRASRLGGLGLGLGVVQGVAAPRPPGPHPITAWVTRSRKVKHAGCWGGARLPGHVLLRSCPLGLRSPALSWPEGPAEEQTPQGGGVVGGKSRGQDGPREV